MQKFVTDMLFGLAFGIGFAFASGVLAFVVSLAQR